MSLAFTKQKFQDWCTQQWVILCGKQIDEKSESWLIGPFGDLGVIGDNFVTQLANKEGLILKRNTISQGLLLSIHDLNFSITEVESLSKKVIDFYESTSNYTLEFSVHWNSFFKFFGILVNKLFSRRLDQLNIPIHNNKQSKNIDSEIITLSDPVTQKIKYTVWFRTSKVTGKVIYSGIYSICKLPSGKRCVKAVFPLPKGNATVLMTPTIGKNGGLILDSSGKKFGDAGFYFLLNDSKGRFWSNYISSFRDQLHIFPSKDNLVAEQVLTLWRKRVLHFNYEIKFKNMRENLEI